MGILNMFEKSGMDCEPDENTGNLHCRKFNSDKKSKFASGSEATISVDPQTCKASFIGRFSVLEEDEKDFERMAKKRESACRGGIQ